MEVKFKPTITVFHCINAFSDLGLIPSIKRNSFEMRTVKLPCSSMIKDVYLLRAFESGSDGVIVLVCPEGQCRYVDGNLRARKRVGRVRNILDNIGLDGRRLSLFNITPEDREATVRIVMDTLSDLEKLGPNPAS